MKTVLSVIAAAAISLVATAGNPTGNSAVKEVKYEVNTEKSAISWKGKKVTGEHFGKLKFKSGSFVAFNDQLSGGEFETDMNTITCEDLSGGVADKLVGHLKSKDFFHVEEFPEATLEIISIQPEADDNYTIEAELSIKGITHTVTFPAQATMNGKTLAARGELIFDRTLYDIKYGSGKFVEGLGDKMIYDDVALSFVIICEAVESNHNHDHAGHKH